MKSFKLHHRLMQTSSEEAFNLWIELKSFQKVAKHLETTGDINPRTGKRFSGRTVADTVYRWVIEHPKETKSIIEEKIYGQEIEPDHYNRWLVRTAMEVYDTSWEKQRDWIIRHGMEKYKEAWDARSPDGTLD